MLCSLKTWINDNFGSKRGLISALKYKLLFAIGFYRECQRIDFSIVSRLVFICSGNICRSPFGEYMAKAKGLNAVSYGLHCRGGHKADPRALHEANLRGVDMSSHITQNISECDVRKGDLFLVMEPQHLLELKINDMKVGQVTILPLWYEEPVPFLGDPFNSNNIFFSRCESIVEQCVSNIQLRLSMVETPVQRDLS